MAFTMIERAIITMIIVVVLLLFVTAIIWIYDCILTAAVIYRMCCSRQTCILTLLFLAAIFLLCALMCITINIHTGGSIEVCTCNGL